MRMEFKETTIVENFVAEMANRSFGGIKDITQMLVEAALKSSAIYLKRVRKNDKCVALIVDEVGSEPALVCILTHHEADGEGQSNFTFELSFNKEDVPEDAVIYNINDNPFYSVSSQVGMSLHGLIYNTPTHISIIYYVAFKVIKEWLLQNCDTEEMTLVLPGYFTATAANENGEKVLSIVPDGQLTRTVKDDAEIEI